MAHPEVESGLWPIEFEYYAAELEDTVDLLLETLKPREKRILELYFGIPWGEPMTYKDVSDMFGLSLERTRQIVINALRKLGDTNRRKLLVEFLDEWKP